MFVNFFKKNKKKTTLFLMGALLLIVIFIIVEHFSYYTKNNEIVKFGFITDVHCYSKFNKEINKWEVNWRCSRPLEEFVDRMNNKFKPDFVVENGDFVDGRDKKGQDGFWKANEIYNKINFPKYHVLGNHETTNMTKEEWLNVVGYEKEYYYYDVKSYRFIVLDGNNVEVPEGSGNIIDMSPTTPHSYKGMIDNEQMIWLEELLSKSDGLKKIVFIHEPPLTQTVGKTYGDIFIKPELLRSIFSKYGVMAVFSGHIEETCDVEIDGVRYFTFHGFHKRNEALKEDHQYKDKGVFHQITLNGDEVNIEMFFSEGEKEPYRSIEVNQDTAICNNSSLPPQD